MAITLNTDNLETIKNNRTVYADAAESYKKGVGVCVEICDETGVKSFMETGKNLEEGGQAFCKTLVEMDELLQKVIEEYQETDEL